MLGKLLKYEIKHSARYTATIYLATLAFAAVSVIALVFNSTWLGVMSCFMLYIAGVASVIVTLVSVIKNFYDTLYGRQGYLTFTLPVKCSTVLISKLITSVIWIIVGFIVMGITLLTVFLYAKEKSESIFESFLDSFLVSGLAEMLPSGLVIAETLIMFAVLALLTVITYVGYVFFVVTVANTGKFQSHPKLFGALLFLGIFAGVNTVSNLLTENIPLTFNVATDRVFFAFADMFSVEGTLLSYGIGGTIFSAIVAGGLLALTGYIMEHKVNIK
ncbi:MAG: hypothetical protein J6Q79_04095 [Clostridia bacterium]|nr:hypothetical protein [Clostridia bacterium]